MAPDGAYRSVMGERFELERFGWQAPDRLEIAGTFHDLEQSPDGTPVLVVSGDGEAHQLQSVEASVSGPPEDGKSWQAQFEWDEAPVGIEAAVLEFGTGMTIELPAPGAKPLRRRFIRVRRADEGAVHAAPADEDAAPTDEDATPADEDAVSTDENAAPTEENAAPADAAAVADHEPRIATAGDIALEADLVAAEARIHELRAALERTAADLDHARADLEAERTGRSQDAEQFHDGLARVRASAEQALAAAQAEAQQLRDDGQAARVQAEAELAALREQVAAADELRQRISALEGAGADASEMRADAQRLLERLTTFADAFDAGR